LGVDVDSAGLFPGLCFFEYYWADFPASQG
jgi:hypothetical protein